LSLYPIIIAGSRDIKNYHLVAINLDKLIPQENRDKIEIVSFDHDLGENVDGYWVACQIESMANNYWQASLDDFKFENRMGIILPPFAWEIHSANPVGRRNIEWAMLNAEKYWSKS